VSSHGTEPLVGTIVSGTGEASGFVAIEWFRQAVRTAVGFDPYPGTLNVKLAEPGVVARWRAIRSRAAVRIDPPGADACGGRLVPALIEGDVPVAIVVPDVTRYGDDVLEVVAPVHLRTSLRRGDGDRVTITIT